MSIFDKDLIERKPEPLYARYTDYIFESTAHDSLFYLDFRPWFEIDDEIDDELKTFQNIK